MTEAPAPAKRRTGPVRWILKALLFIVLALFVLGTMGWAAMFLRFSPLPGDPVRIAAAILFAFGTLAAFALLRNRLRTLVVYVVVIAALIAWYYSIPPSNTRNWAKEVAVLPTASVDGNLVTIRNIRNFEYRTAEDFTPRYYDKTFDLEKLQSVDFICVYWGMPAIAHVMVSFGFDGDDRVAFSIEMRNEEGEANSMVRSFFRQYELIYIAADERDVIRVRTDFREPREDVYVFRTRIPIENERKLFLSYVAKIDELSRRPEWYNTLEDNCTTGVLHRVQSYGGKARYNWKILLSGYMPEYLYEIGGIDTSMPFPQLKQISHVNEKVQAIGDPPNFSALIREGLPAPAPLTMKELDAAR